MFRSRAYRVITGAEVIGLFGGGAILNATGNSSYAPGWFAIVVGVHFVAFGRFFTPMFGVLGLLLLAGGTAGTVVGLAGGGKHAIAAVAGLVAAAGLLVAGVYGLVRQRA